MGRALTVRARLLALATSALLCACAQPQKPMYQWDGFQPQLYEHFKGDGSGPSEQLRVLEAQAQRAAAEGNALPPGFRAHLAVLYLKLGRDDEAMLQLEAEKRSFPESAAYMDFLLKRANGGKAIGKSADKSNDKPKDKAVDKKTERKPS